MPTIHFLGNAARATACKASPDFVSTSETWNKVTCNDCINRSPKPFKRKK